MFFTDKSTLHFKYKAKFVYMQLFLSKNSFLKLLFSILSSALVQALGRVLLLLISIMSARLLGAEGFGIYSFALSILVFLAIPAEAGIPIFVLREAAASKSKNQLKSFLGTFKSSVLIVAFSSVFVTGLSLIVTSFYSNKNQETFSDVFALLILTIPFVALTKVLCYAIRGLSYFSISQLVEGCVRPLILLFILICYFVSGVNLISPAELAAANLFTVIATLVVAYLISKMLFLNGNCQKVCLYNVRHVIFNSFPFALIGAAGLISGQVDIVILGLLGSASDVGIYKVATQGALLVSFGIQAANIVVSTRFAELHAKNNKIKMQEVAKNSSRINFLFAFPVGLFMIFYGESMINLLFGIEFSRASVPLAILSFGQIVNSYFGSVGVILNMTGNESIVSKTTWFTAIFNLVMNICFINIYGVIGVAIATTMSLVMWNLILFQAVKRRIGIDTSPFSIF